MIKQTSIFMSVCFACDTIKVPVFAVVFQKSLCKQYRNGWLFDSYVKLKPAFELRKIYTEIKTDSVLSHFQKNQKTPKKLIDKNRTICNNIQSYDSIRHSLQCRNKVKLYIWTISFSSNKNIKKLKAYIMILILYYRYIIQQCNYSSVVCDFKDLNTINNHYKNIKSPKCLN